MQLNAKKYRAVIFDFDGTLYAPNGIGKKLVFADLWNCLKAKKERETRKSLIGADLSDKESFYKEFFARLGEKNRDWYFNRYMPLMVKVLHDKFQARPDAQKLIDALSASGVKVAVLSDYGSVKERTEAIGLHLNPDFLWSTEEMGALKPAKRPFLSVADHLGVTSTETLVIGDRPDTDYAGAQAAGMDCILVKTPKNFESGNPCLMEWNDIVKVLMPSF